MKRGKILRLVLIAFLSVIFLLSAAIAHAEIYTGEGSYVMSEGENLGVAKERAKADTMRNASEQAGVYVKSYSRARNFDLEEDVIETMTANILKLIGNPNFSPLKEVDNLEGVLIHVIIQAQIDDSDIIRWLNKSEEEKSMLISQMEALRKANEEQARQIAELKRQLAQSTTEEDKERITQEFTDADKIFLSNQKVEEGWKLWNKKDFNGAKNLFDEAVQLNSDNADAYFGRGTSYDDLKQHEKAIQDLNKAIEINPSIHSNVYNNRGWAYKNLGQYELAIQDYDKAIKLNPNDDKAYYNRGYAYIALGQYEQAIQDYDKAIKLNPNDDKAYNNRGWAYYCFKKYKQALKDFEKALELNPNNNYAKNNREACLKAMSK